MRRLLLNPSHHAQARFISRARFVASRVRESLLEMNSFKPRQLSAEVYRYHQICTGHVSIIPVCAPISKVYPLLIP